MANLEIILRCWTFAKPLRMFASKIPSASDGSGTVSTTGTGISPKRLMNKGNTVAKPPSSRSPCSPSRLVSQIRPMPMAP